MALHAISSILASTTPPSGKASATGSADKDAKDVPSTSTQPPDTVELSIRETEAASVPVIPSSFDDQALPVPTSVAPDAPTHLNPKDDEPLSAIDQLLSLWGEVTEPTPYDYDHNGVVDMRDLITLLGRMAQSENSSVANREQEKPAEKKPDVVDPGSFGDPSPLSQVNPQVKTHLDDPLSLDGLLEVWGENNGRYDFDDNGVVDMADLITLLGRMARSENPPPNQDSEVATQSPQIDRAAIGAQILNTLTTAPNSLSINLFA